MSAYLTIAEAQAYFDKRLSTDAWDDANAVDRQKALEQATRIIDRLNYIGDRHVDTQDNEFPRGTDTVVPTDIKYATAEIALALLDGVDAEVEYENLNMTAYKYGPVQATFERTHVSEATLVGIPSMIAWRYLIPYLRDPNSVKLNRVS